MSTGFKVTLTAIAILAAAVFYIFSSPTSTGLSPEEEAKARADIKTIPKAKSEK